MTSIGRGAFAYLKDLRSINITEPITEIGPGAFYGCSKLSTVNLESPDTSPFVVSAGGILCKKNTSGKVDEIVWCPEARNFEIAQIGGGSFSDITKIDDFAFANCKDIGGSSGQFSISSNAGNSITIGRYAFYNCTGLTGTLRIDDTVTKILGHAFEGCTGLSTLCFYESTCANLETDLATCFKDCHFRRAFYVGDTDISSSWAGPGTAGEDAWLRKRQTEIDILTDKWNDIVAMEGSFLDGSTEKHVLLKGSRYARFVSSGTGYYQQAFCENLYKGDCITRYEGAPIPTADDNFYFDGWRKANSTVKLAVSTDSTDTEIRFAVNSDDDYVVVKSGDELSPINVEAYFDVDNMENQDLNKNRGWLMVRTVRFITNGDEEDDSNYSIRVLWNKDSHTGHILDGKSWPADPKNGDLEFEGWYVWNSAQLYTIDTPIRNNVSLEPRFGAEYTVRFIAHDGETVISENSFKDGYRFGQDEIDAVTEKLKEQYNLKSTTAVRWQLRVNDTSNKYLTVRDQVRADTDYYANLTEVVDIVFDSTMIGGDLETKTVKVGESVYFTDAASSDDYEFMGWFEYPDGQGQEYRERIMATKDMTIYGYWRRRYKVTFHFLTEDKEDEYQYALVGESVAALPSITGIFRDGYVLDRDKVWYTKDPEVDIVTDNDLFTLSTKVYGPTHVYAYWHEAIKVEFDTDGGEGGVISVNVIKNNRITSTFMPNTPIRLGYTFMGWFSEKNGEGYEITEDTIVKEAFRCYALWEKKLYNEYFVNFDSMGGTSIERQIVRENYLAEEPEDPYWEDHLFEGWYTDEAYTVSWNFAEDKVTKNTILYAKWHKVIYYAVSYNSQGGSHVDYVVVSENSLLTKPSPDPYMDREHGLKGWFLDREGLLPWDFAKDRVSDNMTLYAVWVNYPYYDIEFDSMGGSSVSSQRVSENQLLVLPENPTYDEWHTFQGWYTDSDYTNRWTFATDTVSQDMTLYAKWFAYYKVDFETNGAKSVSWQILSQNSLIPDPGIPEYNGWHRFEGWYRDPRFSASWNFAVDRVRSHMTLYAKWEYVNYYTVSFNTFGAQEITGLYVSENSLIERPSDPLNSKYYRFEGWYLDPECTRAWDFDTMRVVQNLVLYAKWRYQYVVVSFNSMGGSSVRAQTISENTRLTRPANPRYDKDHRFEGWYTDTSFRTPWDFETMTVSQNMYLYAKWYEYKYYEVSFNSLGGSAVDRQVISENQCAKRPSDPKWGDNHRFDGWFRDPAFEHEWDFEKMPVSGDMVLYAKWYDYKYYTVDFETDGGSTVSQQLVREYALASRPKDPTYADNSIFEGWFKDEDYKEAWDFEKDLVSQNTVIYANRVTEEEADNRKGIIWTYLVKNEKAKISRYFNGNIVAIATDDSSVARISPKKDLLVGKRIGTTMLRATSGNGDFPVSYKVHVVKQKLSNMQAYNTGTSLYASDYLTYPNVLPDRWVCSNKNVASVDPKTGEIKVKKNGKAKITAVYGKIKVSGSLRSYVANFKEKVVKIQTGQTKKIKIKGISKEDNVSWYVVDGNINTKNLSVSLNRLISQKPTMAEIDDNGFVTIPSVTIFLIPV